MAPTGHFKRLTGEEMKERLAEIKAAQSEPLREKVRRAKALIAAIAERGPMAVMFSGGRDSTAVALLAREHKPTLLYCNTGLSTPAALERIYRMARALRLNLIEAHPAYPAFEMWQKLGHYPIGPKRGHTYLKQQTMIKSSPVQCCYHLKEKPAKKLIRDEGYASILWGNRAADSDRRKLGIADHGILQPPSNRWPCWSVQPIAYFTDQDIAEILRRQPGEWTERGEDGCAVCCTDLGRPDSQLARALEEHPYLFHVAIRAGLGREILKAQGKPHTDADVTKALREDPSRFLWIPKIGKDHRDEGTISQPLETKGGKP